MRWLQLLRGFLARHAEGSGDKVLLPYTAKVAVSGAKIDQRHIVLNQ